MDARRHAISGLGGRRALRLRLRVLRGKNYFDAESGGILSKGVR